MNEYHDLDYVVSMLEVARTNIEESYEGATIKSDVLAEYLDKLANMIADAEKRRDGEPLDQMLAEQARDEREARDWYQRGVA